MAARKPRATRRPLPSPRPARPRLEPVTPARWGDLERLFGPRGACAGCWCMWMRLPSAEWKRGKGEQNRRALRSLVRRRPPGLLAYDGDEPVAWIALAPREEYRRLENSRVLAPVPGERVWAAPCFYVKPSHRGAGMSARLLAAALEFARERGAGALEGYPTANAARRQPAAFVWTGFESTFRAAGFTEIARRSPSRPILRRVLSPRRAPAGQRTDRARTAAGRLRERPSRAPRRSARHG